MIDRLGMKCVLTSNAFKAEVKVSIYGTICSHVDFTPSAYRHDVQVFLDNRQLYVGSPGHSLSLQCLRSGLYTGMNPWSQLT